MGLKDLEGKRTGRPRGAKTTSRVRRDILWAYRNLDNPDAKPPSPGARMWTELARTQPGHFLACVVKVDTAGEREADGEGESGVPSPEPEETGGLTLSLLGGKSPRRLKTMTLCWQTLVLHLGGEFVPW